MELEGSLQCLQGPSLCLLLHHQGDNRPDDGGSKYIWHMGQFLPDYTAQHPKRQPSLSAELPQCLGTTLWKWMGCGGEFSHIFNQGTRQWWVVSSTLRLSYPRRKNPRYPLDRRLCELRSRYGRVVRGKRRNSCPWNDSRPGLPEAWSSSKQLVTSLTELSLLMQNNISRFPKGRTSVSANCVSVRKLTRFHLSVKKRLQWTDEHGN
jgi:hypothetical protein